MRKLVNEKNIKFVLLFGVILSGVVSSLFVYNLKLEKLIQQIPKEVVVANASATEVDIFWKIPIGEYQIVSYREKTSSAPYTKFIDVLNYKDNISESSVFVASLSDLKPDTTYSLRFESKDRIWDRGYEFKTAGIEDKVTLPDIKNGDSNIDTLVLVKREDGSFLMFDTGDYGTWAFDSKGEKYEAQDYAQISSEEKLTATLRRYLVPYAYALAGANCQTNITIRNLVYEPTDKERVAKKSGELARNYDRSVCPGGHYVYECYEDVYCTSVERGIDPGFVFSIWYSETASSNYAAYGSTTRDFGIDKSDMFTNFAAQLDWLTDKSKILNMDYIAGCDDPNFSKEVKWAAKYGYGNCKTHKNLVNGSNYYSKINRNYNGILTVTNKDLLFPFYINPNPNACDRSRQQTNGVYRDCNGNKTGSNTEGRDPSSGLDKDEMIVSNKDRACTDSNGCICIYGEERINASKGQTCTVDKRVITTPWSSDTCWYISNNVCKSTTHDCANLPKAYPTESQCKANLSSSSSSNTGNTGTGTGSGSVTPQQPDPSVDCSGPDTITGKFDIHVGEVCRDVGGCECFKGEIVPANYIKDVACGMRCIEEPEANGQIVTEKVCCLTGDNLALQISSSCQGTVIPDIEENYCRTERGKYTINKGVNFVKGVKTLDTSTLKFSTAHDLIKLSNKKIIAIGLFRDNSWKKVVNVDNGAIKGADFKIEPGESYLVVSLQEFEIPYVGYSAQPPSIEKMIGWNLVPITVFNNQVYSSVSLLKNLSFNDIHQVAQWNSKRGMFDYTIRDKHNNIIGEDLRISALPAIFIKVQQ